MIDCGATASAGPEELVKGLIRTVLTQDKGAAIAVDSACDRTFVLARGNGVELCAGQPCHLWLEVVQRLCFARTRDLHHPNFDRDSLAPILPRMDHLGGPSRAMLIDFATGLAMDSHDEHLEPHQLPCNSKGHYICDVVYFLTKGVQCHEGHSSVHVAADSPANSGSSLHLLEFHPAEFYDLTIRDDVSDVFKVQSVERLHKLRHAAARSQQDHMDMVATAAPMGQTAASSFPNLQSSSPRPRPC